MTIPTRLFPIGVLLTLLIAMTPALEARAGAPQTLDFSPAADNTLYERPTGDLSNGAGPALFIGRTGANAGEVLRRALLRFDLNAIPPGSEVLSARLEFNVDMVPPMSTGFDATLHRVQAAWGEAGSLAPGAGGGGTAAQPGDATWLHRFFDTEFWATPGGDFDPTTSGTAPLDAGIGAFAFESTPALVTDVQIWVNQPGANFGWIVLGEEDNPENARRIASRENAALAPTLEVQFIPALLPQPAVPVSTLNVKGLTLMILVLGLLAGQTMRTRRRAV